MRGLGGRTAPRGRRRGWAALAGTLLWAAGAAAAGGISCPTGAQPPNGKEPPVDASAPREGAEREAAPVDAVRPARTEAATFALG